MERIVVQRHFPKANIPQLKRVAAYARVSSGKDAMLHSLSAQVSYYSNLIQNHSGWQYTGVYADEALTGTKERISSGCWRTAGPGRWIWSLPRVSPALPATPSRCWRL